MDRVDILYGSMQNLEVRMAPTLKFLNDISTWTLYILHDLSRAQNNMLPGSADGNVERTVHVSVRGSVFVNTTSTGTTMYVTARTRRKFMA